MKLKLATKLNKESGFSTLDLLIALPLLILCIVTVIIVSFGNQSVSLDSQTNSEAIAKAQNLIEQARAQSRLDFGSVVTTSTTTEDIYDKKTVVNAGQCGSDVTGQVFWKTENRSQSVVLNTHISDIPLAVALGGNCDNSPSGKTWNPPDTWNCDNFQPGKPTGLDALNRKVYMTGDKSPFLYIADTSSASYNPSCHTQTGNLFVNFTNGFADDYQLNDIKIARMSDGQIYGFVARDNNTEQFEILNLNNINQPYSVASSTLAGVSGSAPQGWRLYYFENKVYIVTRFTAGPELHIYNVATPWNPSSVTELGSKDLGRTVESLVINKKFLSGSWHYFAYMATDKDTAPLSVYDVTNPSAVTEVTSAEPVFSGYQDGNAVAVIGNKLYFGRSSDPSGSDLFVYNIFNPLSGSPLGLLGQADINTSVLAIAVSGNFAFLGTSKTSKEFQVWTSDPNDIHLIKTYNFPNVIQNGDKYENDWVYIASEGNDALRILYSPN